MPGEKSLSFNQQLALLPVAIPDCVVDFLEDFSQGVPLQTEAVRNAFDPEYLLQNGEALRTKLDELRKNGGKVTGVAVEPAGKEIPNAYMVKLVFETAGEKGLGVIVRAKERTVFRVVFGQAAYSDEELKGLLKNP